MGGQALSTADKTTNTSTYTDTTTRVSDSYNSETNINGLQGQDLVTIVGANNTALNNILNTYGVFSAGALLNQNDANRQAINSINSAQQQNLQTLSASQTIAQQTALNLVHEFTGLLNHQNNAPAQSVVPTNIMSSLPSIPSSSSDSASKNLQYAALGIAAIGVAILAFKKG